MGRGRQKAKHTKVARELKYFSPDTNYGALEKELGASSDTDVDRWAEYSAADDAEDVDDDLDQSESKSA